MSAAVSTADRLAIAADCERLCLDYCFLADTGAMDAWADLFAEDAEMHLFGKVHAGRAAIRVSVDGGGARTTVHSLSNVRIDVTGPETASGTAYVTVFSADKANPGPNALAAKMIGLYRDDYRRTTAGWRIARRVFEPLITPGR